MRVVAAAGAAAAAAVGHFAIAAAAVPMSQSSLLHGLAVLVGWLVVAGSCIRSLPQILRILRNRRCARPGARLQPPAAVSLLQDCPWPSCTRGCTHSLITD